MPLSLNRVYENRGKILLAALGLMSALAWQRAERVTILETLLSAKPLVKTSSSADIERKVSRGPVERGPVKTTRKVTVAPDGTRTTETVREVASEKVGAVLSESKSHSESAKTETPICPAPGKAKTRYAGVGFSPWNMAQPQFEAGLTLYDRWDIGGAYDTHFPPLGGAAQIRTRIRF